MKLKIKLHPNSSRDEIRRISQSSDKSQTKEKIEKISDDNKDAVSVGGNEKMPPFRTLRKEREENSGLPRFEVWIKEKPIEGKANSYLEKFLKKYFGKNVKVIKGLKSKNKIVEVD